MASVSNLEKLPLEIRLQIYDYLLDQKYNVEDIAIREVHSRAPAPAPSSPDAVSRAQRSTRPGQRTRATLAFPVALFRVNRRLGYEARARFHELNPIAVVVFTSATGWLTELHIPYRRLRPPPSSPWRQDLGDRALLLHMYDPDSAQVSEDRIVVCGPWITTLAASAAHGIQAYGRRPFEVQLEGPRGPCARLPRVQAWLADVVPQLRALFHDGPARSEPTDLLLHVSYPRHPRRIRRQAPKDMPFPTLASKKLHTHADWLVRNGFLEDGRLLYDQLIGQRQVLMFKHNRTRAVLWDPNHTAQRQFFWFDLIDLHFNKVALALVTKDTASGITPLRKMVESLAGSFSRVQEPVKHLKDALTKYLAMVAYKAAHEMPINGLLPFRWQEFMSSLHVDDDSWDECMQKLVEAKCHTGIEQVEDALPEDYRRGFLDGMWANEVYLDSKLPTA